MPLVRGSVVPFVRGASVVTIVKGVNIRGIGGIVFVGEDVEMFGVLLCWHEVGRMVLLARGLDGRLRPLKID